MAIIKDIFKSNSILLFLYGTSANIINRMLTEASHASLDIQYSTQLIDGEYAAYAGL